MLECERLMSGSTAMDVQDLIESVTGEPCPCKQGRRCPLRAEVRVPEQGPVPLLLDGGDRSRA